MKEIENDLQRFIGGVLKIQGNTQGQEVYEGIPSAIEAITLDKVNGKVIVRATVTFSTLVRNPRRIEGTDAFSCDQVYREQKKVQVELFLGRGARLVAKNGATVVRSSLPGEVIVLHLPDSAQAQLFRGYWHAENDKSAA